MFSGGGGNSSTRQAVLACQVCGQDQTLYEQDSAVDTNNEQQEDLVFIMECCFSIVCKDCVSIGRAANAAASQSSPQKLSHSNNCSPSKGDEMGDHEAVQNNDADKQTKKASKRICLACLEPIKSSANSSEGRQPLSFAKYSVLVSLLSSINEAHKKAMAQRQDSSSIFNFITGSSLSNQHLMCHRCQQKEHRYICQTCSGGEPNNPTKLCEECHIVIHSLGASFKAHKIHEAVAGSQLGGSEAAEEASSENVLFAMLASLQECPKHNETIEFYQEEELGDETTFELSGVTYGCQRCVATSSESSKECFTKIDQDNLLNVYQLKQELFKERQKSQATLNSMLTTYNLDIVEKLPEVRQLEIQQVRDVVSRIVKTLYNKQREIEQQIEDKFQKLADHVHKEKQRMLTKKEVVERNYNLLERALEVIPLQILSCEEGLLEAMLMANQGLMKIVRAQETKLTQRQALYLQQETEDKVDAPFHLIQPEQQKLRLSKLESFATQIDDIVTALFKQANDQIDTRQEEQSMHKQYVHHTAASQVNPLTQSAMSPAFQQPMTTLEPASIQSYQTTGFTDQDNNILGTGSSAQGQLFAAAGTHSNSNDVKRQSVQTTKSGVLAAFVTSQNQSKSRSGMQRDQYAKSHLSIGQQFSSNQLDLAPEKRHNEQSQRSSKGGTSRRDQSYNGGNRGSSQTGTAAHQAYLQTASHRYVANAAAGKQQQQQNTSQTGLTKSQSMSGKWDSSTRVLNNKKTRENSVSSQNVVTNGQSVPRNSTYQNPIKERSQNRQSVTMTQGVVGSRGGAHSTVGQSERWAANAVKRNANLNISQDFGERSNNGDLQNQRNTPGDSSPRLSRNRVSMNNLATNKDRSINDPEKLIIKENVAIIEQNCLAPRIFTHVAQTSTAIQVAWSHPSNFQKMITSEDENGQMVQRKQHIQYVLEYGIGVKVDNKEQFRQIYKGKAHKCIITDLMPRTTFRLRVAPILNMEKSATDQTLTSEGGDSKKNVTTVQEQGEWSEVTNITTKETQTFDVGGVLSSHSPKAPNLMCAQLVSKGRKRWLTFDKAGTLLATYGYSFGEHLWCLKIQYQEHSNIASLGGGAQASSALDQSGSMVVGVVNKRFSNQKMFGSVINYSIFKGEIVVKIFLDSNKKRLTIYSPQHPQGDTYTDLPKDGLFFPAVQNKTSISKQKSSLKVHFKFDQLIPKEKSEIGSTLVYSSDEGADNMTNDDLSQSASMYGGATGNQSMNQGKEDGKRADLSRRGTTRSNNEKGGGQRPASGSRHGANQNSGNGF